MSETTMTTFPADEMTETGAAPNTAPADTGDDWDDIDLSDVKDNDLEEDEHEPDADTKEPPEADQQDGESGEEADEKADTKEDKPAERQEAADQQLFELKHLGEVKQVGRDEVVTLAQKGLNYDHIRQERDTARQEVARLSELEQFLKELAAPQGMSVEDLIDSTRANVLADREGLDKEVALQRVKLERDRKAFEAERQKGIQAQQEADREETRRRDSFLKFAKEYPGVDPKSIPKEVWDKFGEGVDLTDAYSRYENKKLKDELSAMTAKLEAEKQNNKNKERSTGSQKSAGSEHDNMDAIDRDWYSGD